MIFLVSAVFIFLFYVIPLHAVVINRPPIFPVLGGEGSWLLTALIAYSFIGLAALTITRFEEVLWPSLPAFREKITRRTGIQRLDGLGWRFSALAAILFIATDPALIPMAVAGVLGFWSLSRRPVVLRTVRLDPTETGTKEPETKDMQASEDDETELRVFEWQVNDEDAGLMDVRLTLPIDPRRYAEFHRTNPANHGPVEASVYPRLVRDGLTEEIKAFAGKIRGVANERGFNSYQEISLVLAFVQSIPGVEDTQTRADKYTRWPIETLYENGGDSDCKAVLLATVLRELGYPVVILESSGQTAVGVGAADGIPGRFLTHRGNKYYYCEPARTGKRVGQVPDDLASDQLLAYEIEETPSPS